MIIEKLIEYVFNFLLSIFSMIGKIPILQIPTWSVDFRYFLDIAFIFFPSDVYITLLMNITLWLQFDLGFAIVMWIVKKIPFISVE